jgi:hypothetical protein
VAVEFVAVANGVFPDFWLGAGAKPAGDKVFEIAKAITRWGGGLVPSGGASAESEIFGCVFGDADWVTTFEVAESLAEESSAAPPRSMPRAPVRASAKVRDPESAV